MLLKPLCQGTCGSFRSRRSSTRARSCSAIRTQTMRGTCSGVTSVIGLLGNRMQKTIVLRTGPFRAHAPIPERRRLRVLSPNFCTASRHVVPNANITLRPRRRSVTQRTAREDSTPFAGKLQRGETRRQAARAAAHGGGAGPTVPPPSSLSVCWRLLSATATLMHVEMASSMVY